MRTALQPEVEQRIGRNLLRYQLVELRLKQMLPLRSIKISTDGIDDLRADIEGRRRSVLGVLIRAYLDGLEGPESAREQFEAHFKQFLDARNRLVHHLLEDASLLLTEQQCRECIQRLDEEYAFAEGIARQIHDAHQYLVDTVRTFTTASAEAATDPANAEAVWRKHGERLAIQHGAEVHLNVELSPLDILAEAMALTEQARRRPDGWTVFANVGHRLRQEFSELPPGLLAMARQLEQYEFRDRPTRPDGGSAWMYRRRTSDNQGVPTVQR